MVILKVLKALETLKLGSKFGSEYQASSFISKSDWYTAVPGHRLGVTKRLSPMGSYFMHVGSAVPSD